MSMHTEHQALAIERLRIEVSSAKRNGFLSIQPIGTYEAAAILEALDAVKILENNA